MNLQPIIACVVLSLLGAATAEAQTPMRLRGTITAVEGETLAIRTREGKDMSLQLAEKLSVAVARPAKFEDIKEGDYVGSAAMKRDDGKLVAMEVHYLPPAVPPGHIPWDLAPGTTMTNAHVSAIVQATGKRELTLKYEGGSQTILVPEGTPVVRAVPGSRSDLAKGEYVFVAAQSSPDGKVTALRIQVSKDGVKPPM